MLRESGIGLLALVAIGKKREKIILHGMASLAAETEFGGDGIPYERAVGAMKKKVLCTFQHVIEEDTVLFRWMCLEASKDLAFRPLINPIVNSSPESDHSTAVCSGSIRLYIINGRLQTEFTKPSSIPNHFILKLRKRLNGKGQQFKSVP